MSVRRLLRVVRFDLAHAPRRFLFWLWLALLLFITWGLSSGGVSIASSNPADLDRPTRCRNRSMRSRVCAGQKAPVWR